MSQISHKDRKESVNLVSDLDLQPCNCISPLRVAFNEVNISSKFEDYMATVSLVMAYLSSYHYVALAPFVTVKTNFCKLSRASRSQVKAVTIVRNGETDRMQ